MDRLPQTHKIQNPNSLKSANSSPQLLRTEVRPETRVNFPEALPGLADVQAPIEARRVSNGFLEKGDLAGLIAWSRQKMRESTQGRLLTQMATSIMDRLQSESEGVIKKLS